MSMFRLISQWWDDLRQWVQRPGLSTAILQVAKAVIATSAAWAVSVYILQSSMPFLAPWTALLTVHATVYRSLSHGVQSTVATAIGVGLSFLVGNYLGVSLWTFSLALLVGLIGAQITWIRDEGVMIATTAIFVLSDVYSGQDPLLVDRIVEVGVGVVIGIVVNVLVLPPLRDRQAARYVDSINQRMGGILINMADELSDSWDSDNAEEWYEESQSITEELNDAWETVRFARESERGNPRRLVYRARQGQLGMPGRSSPSEQSDQQDQQKQATYEEILSRVSEGISHLRNLTRTLRDASYSEGAWDDEFRQRWVQIIRDAGERISDPEAEVESLYDRLTDLSYQMSNNDDLPSKNWPLYGALITSVQHVVLVVDDVASAQHARA